MQMCQYNRFFEFMWKFFSAFFSFVRSSTVEMVETKRFGGFSVRTGDGAVVWFYAAGAFDYHLYRDNTQIYEY